MQKLQKAINQARNERHKVPLDPELRPYQDLYDWVVGDTSSRPSYRPVPASIVKRFNQEIRFAKAGSKEFGRQVTRFAEVFGHMPTITPDNPQAKRVQIDMDKIFDEQSSIEPEYGTLHWLKTAFAPWSWEKSSCVLGLVAATLIYVSPTVTFGDDLYLDILTALVFGALLAVLLIWVNPRYFYQRLTCLILTPLISTSLLGVRISVSGQGRYLGGYVELQSGTDPYTVVALTILSLCAMGIGLYSARSNNAE